MKIKFIGLLSIILTGCSVCMDDAVEAVEGMVGGEQESQQKRLVRPGVEPSECSVTCGDVVKELVQ